MLKTSSGKIRRSATRDAYVNDTFGRGRSRRGNGPPAAQRGRRPTWRERHRWWPVCLFTAYVISILLITLPVLWRVLARSVRPAGARDRAAKRWSRLALTLCGIRLRVTGLEQLKDIRAGILVANHASYIDPVVLMAAIPPDFRFIAKRRLADYPLIGTVIRKAGHVTIEKADVSQRLAGAEDIAGLLAAGRAADDFS